MSYKSWYIPTIRGYPAKRALPDMADRALLAGYPRIVTAILHPVSCNCQHPFANEQLICVVVIWLEIDIKHILILFYTRPVI